MIEVTVIETGDCAEAEDEEAAVLAARTIGEEARRTLRIWGNDPTLTFTVDGNVVRTYKLSTLRKG